MSGVHFKFSVVAILVFTSEEFFSERILPFDKTGVVSILPLKIINSGPKAPGLPFQILTVSTLSGAMEEFSDTR